MSSLSLGLNAPCDGAAPRVGVRSFFAPAPSPAFFSSVRSSPALQTDRDAVPSTSSSPSSALY